MQTGIYYVYHHVRLSDGLVFYVGKGKERRHKSRRDRNKWWHHVAEKHGYITVFIREGLSESCAYALEYIEIAKQRSLGQPLVNATDGGEGSRGFIPHWRKEVNCSNGMKFESLTEASAWLVAQGFTRAKPSSVSACCLGKVSHCYGMAWWFDGDKPRKVFNAKAKANEHKQKSVLCSNGLEFPSVNSASRWAAENINERYTASIVSACCRGVRKSSYGLSWSFK